MVNGITTKRVQSIVFIKPEMFMAGFKEEKRIDVTGIFAMNNSNNT